MNIREIKELKVEELHSELARMRRHLFDLRSQAVTEKLGNPRQVTRTKRDIARILTVLTERGEKNVEQTQDHLSTRTNH